MDDEKTKEQLLLEISYLKNVILEWEAKCHSLQELTRSTEERFLNITSAVSDYIFSVHIVDGKPVETVHGPACYSITGYTPKEFYENPYLWINMVYPEDRALVLDNVAKILSGKESKPLEHRIIRKDGVIRWVRNTPVCQYDTDGKLKTYDGLIQDITEIKRTYETLRLSEEKFSKAFRSSPDPIIISTVFEGRIIDVNYAFERDFGYLRDEVIGKQVKNLNLWANYKERETLIKDLLDNGIVNNREIEMRARKGDIMTMLISAELIVMADEQCMINVMRDITVRKQTIDRLETENKILKNNLDIQIAKLDDIINMYIHQSLQLAFRDLDTLEIQLSQFTSVNSPDINKYVRYLLEVLTNILGITIDITIKHSHDTNIHMEESKQKVLMIVIFRIIEMLLCISKGSVYLEMKLTDKLIEICYEHPIDAIVPNNYKSTLKWNFKKTHMDLLLINICSRLLEEELKIYEVGNRLVYSLKKL
ncbi:MAG: PAS domain S-box protein [Thermodesulfovibrionales bacterium]|nr:PAS domain S-box protein [Thermodesulfovibrionales bacterium]